MERQSDIQKAIDFFNKNPQKNKYSRKENGLLSSYIKAKDIKGNEQIIRLKNKTEDAFLGRGEFGRVKKIESNKKEETCIKIQKISTPFELTQVIRESNINLDMGVAINPLIKIQQLDNSIKVYQEMKNLGKAISSYLTELKAEEKLDIAIEMILAIYNLHSGITSKSKTEYIHGDIRLGNFVIDQRGAVTLIDFAKTTIIKNPISEKMYFENKDLLTTLFLPPSSKFYNQVPESLFEENDLKIFPLLILILNPQKYERSLEQNITLKFIVSSLIAYRYDHKLSSESIDDLKQPKNQDLLINKYYKDKETVDDLRKYISQREKGKEYGFFRQFNKDQSFSKDHKRQAANWLQNIVLKPYKIEEEARNYLIYREALKNGKLGKIFSKSYLKDIFEQNSKKVNFGV